MLGNRCTVQQRLKIIEQAGGPGSQQIVRDDFYPVEAEVQLSKDFSGSGGERRAASEHDEDSWLPRVHQAILITKVPRLI